ncbi:class 1 fructose-bisphosphatase [Frigidibacter sp. MR17.14]|uniref:class 1 fructose-bisphosphatase n=1 Tax=Frigidibacter sp. MR17.14 TaxID=3126509 RepID=UPI0030130195
MTESIDLPAGAVPVQLSAVLKALCTVARDISATIAYGPLAARLGDTVGANSDGDAQKALDLIADEAFAAALAGTGIRWLASEERDTVTGIDPDGAFAIALDPLDGSSNIGVNVSVGSIFGIWPAGDGAEASVLRPGRELLAAGYFIYGPQTALMVSVGQGVMEFLLDPRDRVFRLVAPEVRIEPVSAEFAINASNYRHWSKPVRAYVDDCLAGATGPHESDANMRWIASLVAETHRILMRGGLFLYPADARKGYERGRLRLVYECAPIAFLVEQAGGRATNGIDPILDRVPASLHERTPFVFGSAPRVERVTVYHDLPEQEIAALFGSRGLFRH